MSQRRFYEQELVPASRGLAEPQVERDAVREQLERILAHPLFTHSKRYPLLLRWVVERTLEGHSAQLKERTLGAEVFGREPSYDTNTDPVVRITAGEIRKRIALYYHEAGRENEVRIELPCGSYVPEFHRPLQAEREAKSPVEVQPAMARPKAGRTTVLKPSYLIGTGAAMLAGLAIWFFWGSPLDPFWRPFLDSPGTPLLCIGGRGIASEVSATPAPDSQTITVTDQIHREYVAFSDATTLTMLAGLFQAKGRPYSMRIGSSTTFADLRSGPVVLVGGFNNGWTMRLLSQLRYHLARDPATNVEWIEDRTNPAKRDWAVDSQTPNLKLTEDYAIISRVTDPATERMVVVAAGVLQYGTIAAGEFLTNPKYLEALARQAPANWQRKNMQVVIATKVINGNSGPPSIVASYFW